MNQNIRQETQKKIMDVRPFVNKWKSVNKDWVANTFCEIADWNAQVPVFLVTYFSGEKRWNKISGLTYNIVGLIQILEELIETFQISEIIVNKAFWAIYRLTDFALLMRSLDSFIV